MIAQCGVLGGKPTRRQVASRDSPHYQVLIECAGEHHRIAVDVMSTEKPHEVLYLIDGDYQHEMTSRLHDVEDGLTYLRSELGGLALDYVRGHLFETRRMRTLPAEPGADNDITRCWGR